jgi:crotonobetainyl-CoA:carnitine CoA-transferase CaiB-like acyl-CoA transferase
MTEQGAAARREGPLAGILVADLSRVLTGPYAAMMLGDLGARVIKVERPGAGDDTRSWGPPFAGPEGRQESTYFLSANRNKESLVLDFKVEEDRALLTRLIERADVVVENFRPGVMERIGFGHDKLLSINPRIVVLSITGFGHDGPESERSGYDQIVQGEAGLMSFTGPSPEQPTKMGVAIADILAGIFGAYGVAAALFERERTGKGRIVRTSLLAGVVGVHTFQGTRWLVAGEVPVPQGNRHPTVAPYGAFKCKDGFVQIAVGNETIWRRFAPLIGVDPDDQRYSSNGARVARYDELAEMIGATLAQGDLEHWLRELSARDIPAGEIKPLDRVYDWEQVASQDLIVETVHSVLGPIRLPGSPLRFDDGGRREHLPPPTLGEHSDAIRAWLAEGVEGG